MSLFDNYERSGVSSYLVITSDYTKQSFPGNALGTCAGQVMTWFKSLAGQLPTGEGEKQTLLSPSEKSTSIQYGALKNGTALRDAAASPPIDLRGTNKAEAIKQATPWTGKYKLYSIANNLGHGHALGVYFPWSGNAQFYDPNLVCGTLKEGKWLYELLSKWPELYVGCGGPSATWGFETLFIFSDPEAALKKLGE